MLGKFVYPTLPKSLRMLLVYPERMAVGVKGGKEVCLDYHRHRLGNTSFKVPRECRQQNFTIIKDQQVRHSKCLYQRWFKRFISGNFRQAMLKRSTNQPMRNIAYNILEADATHIGAKMAEVRCRSQYVQFFLMFIRYEEHKSSYSTNVADVYCYRFYICMIIKCSI